MSPLEKAMKSINKNLEDSSKSQKARLVSTLVITGEYMTLEEIANYIRVNFKRFDTPAALSARWRQVNNSYFVTKHKRIRQGTKNLYEYSIKVRQGANDA